MITQQSQHSEITLSSAPGRKEVSPCARGRPLRKKRAAGQVRRRRTHAMCVTTMIKLQGVRANAVPTLRNYTAELPAFEVIAGVKLVEVQ